MKLLFDQNLSPRLVRLLADVFPGSSHVRDLDLQSAADELIWERARCDGLVIVSKDEDFHQRSFLLGQPPKVIWVRLGNCSTDAIARLLTKRQLEIAAFEADSQASFLVLAGFDD